MAIPATPQNFNVQTANIQTYCSWNISAGATSYDVQRSTDNITYASVATPAVTGYLDTTVSAGTQYWYKVAAVNSSGTSAYTTPQSVVPVVAGEMSLGQIRLNAQRRADRVGSEFLTMPEWNTNINQSLTELYDLLVTSFQDYFLQSVEFTTSGSQDQYPLPNGVNYDGARPFYKIQGVDLGINTAQNAWVTVEKFNWIDRNRYVYPNTASVIYGVFNMRYRVMGNNLHLIPTPSASQPMRVWYIPRMEELLQDVDTTDESINGWIEYVIVDAAIKALQKEESDVSVLMAQKQALIKRIQDSAPSRDAGMPNTISDSRGNSDRYGGGWGGYGGNGPSGGF